jgi:hypothetical protein
MPGSVSGYVMSTQPPNELQVVAGQVRVESRVVVWIRCPICHREHRHVLTLHDHPTMPGLRLWRVDCQGASYILRLSSSAIATALEQAAEIATEHGLSQNWLSDESVEECCLQQP